MRRRLSLVIALGVSLSAGAVAAADQRKSAREARRITGACSSFSIEVNQDRCVGLAKSESSVMGCFTVLSTSDEILNCVAQNKSKDVALVCYDAFNPHGDSVRRCIAYARSAAIVTECFKAFEGAGLPMECVQVAPSSAVVESCRKAAATPDGRIGCVHLATSEQMVNDCAQPGDNSADAALFGCLKGKIAVSVPSAPAPSTGGGGATDPRSWPR